eukprot:gene9806-9964_t
MAKSYQFAAIVAAIVLLMTLCGNVEGGKSSCFFVDGDCKPDPAGLPAGAKGAAGCVNMPGKGCTLTPAARKTILGSLAPTFAQCTGLAPSACAANGNCKVGANNACVIAAPGIASTFGLKTNFPAATSILVSCKALVANPAACDAA